MLRTYDLSADDTVSHRRVLVDCQSYSGPDGMVADIAGALLRRIARREPAG